jgi:thioester reductase-like protein
MTQEADTPAPTDTFGRLGILLTGATGFLGGHVLAQAAHDLPEGEVIYCLVRDKNRGARDRLDEVAVTHGIAQNRFVMVPGTLDTPDFGLDASALKALAASVRQVIHCAAMVNLAIGRKEMMDWSARGMETVLQFCRNSHADLRFTSSSSVFPDRGGPWPESPADLWDDITGYGAAKIAAETAIRASGIPAAIVRLPSLYDLDAPNPRDIYEIILEASLKARQIPQSLTFPMTDVTAAAAFLLGPITATDAPFYNLMADTPVTPDDPNAVPVRDWLAKVDLDPGIANVIVNFPETLQADALFINTAARNAWARISDRAYSAISDGDTLLSRRTSAYQSAPALT